MELPRPYLDECVDIGVVEALQAQGLFVATVYSEDFTEAEVQFALNQGPPP